MPLSTKKSQKGAGHRERLRQRFLVGGLEGFHDYEVIELLLTLGTPRRDCKDAAKAALARFKTLQGVLEASTQELCDIAGIGPRNAFGIRLAKAVVERYLEKKLIHKEAISCSQDLVNYLCGSMRDKHRECFKAVFLNSKNRVITVETLSEGTLTSSSVYPREVIQAALGHRAAALIFAHNHPSGDPTPSAEDLSVTRQLVFAGRLLGIAVHDHVIIGENCFYSLADQGHIARMNSEYERDGRSGASRALTEEGGCSPRGESER
jgi:DNA repair protein RadC